MSSFFPTDRINTSASIVPPTHKVCPSVVPAMTTNTSPSRSSENGDKKKEESDEVWGYFEAQSSFLGPSLWDNGDLKVGNQCIFKMNSIPVCVFFLPLVFHTPLKLCLDIFIYEGERRKQTEMRENVSMS